MAAAAVLMLACCINYAASSLALNTVNESIWSQAESQAKALAAKAGQLKTEYDQANTEFHATDQIGQHLVRNVEGRLRWLELLKAVNGCLPPYANDPPSRKTPRRPMAARISARDELHVTSLDCQQVDDVSTWYAGVKRWDPTAASSDAAAGPATPTPPPAAPMPGVMPGKPPARRAGAHAAPWGTRASRRRRPGPMPGAVRAPPPRRPAIPPAGPTGPGWIVQITGYHYHNADRDNQGAQYVRNTLIQQLREGKLELPAAQAPTPNSIP